MEQFCGLLVMLLIQLIVPMFLGRLLMRVVKKQSGWVLIWLMGIFCEWAIFQLIAVPAIKIQTSLTVVTVIWCITILFCLCVEFVFLIREKRIDLCFGNVTYFKENKVRILLLLTMLGTIGYQIYMTIAYQFIDRDDARFVANAVAAWDSDKMLLVHPNTGEALSEPIGELRKDAVAPWMIFFSMLAKISDIHPTIIAHSIFPFFLVVIGYCVYWFFSENFWKSEYDKRMLFVTLVAFLILFGGKTIYTAETFFLLRLWQGKAIVGAIMLPFLTALLVKRTENVEDVAWDIMVFITAIATCLLSGMGIILGAFLISGFVLVQTIQMKKLTFGLRGLLICLPCIIYGILYMG